MEQTRLFVRMFCHYLMLGMLLLFGFCLTCGPFILAVLEPGEDDPVILLIYFLNGILYIIVFREKNRRGRDCLLNFLMSLKPKKLQGAHNMRNLKLPASSIFTLPGVDLREPSLTLQLGLDGYPVLDKHGKPSPIWLLATPKCSGPTSVSDYELYFYNRFTLAEEKYDETKPDHQGLFEAFVYAAFPSSRSEIEKNRQRRTEFCARVSWEEIANLKETPKFH